MKHLGVSAETKVRMEARLKAAHDSQVRLDLSAVPQSLRKHAPLAAVWGLRDDALRQFHMSKHAMAEILAVHDTIEKDRRAFEDLWKKIEEKVLSGCSLSPTEQCFWALATVFAEVEAHIAGHGRSAQ